MKYLITILILIMGFSLKSQVISYPILDTSKDGRVLVTMTIEQAQRLDNLTELVPILEKMGVDASDYDSACIKVVNGQNQIIATQVIEINDLKSESLIRSQEISNLQSQIENYKKDSSDCDAQKKDQDQIIKDQAKTIRKQRVKMIVGGAIEGIAIVGLIFLLVLHH